MQWDSAQQVCRKMHRRPRRRAGARSFPRNPYYRNSTPVRLPLLVAFSSIIFSGFAFGQSGFDYDQQSAMTGGGAAQHLSETISIGQTFVPTLSSVGFVRLFIGDAFFDNHGATLLVNLHSDGPSGSVLSTSNPVMLPDQFGGQVNFYFSNPPQVTPGATYFIECVLRDSWSSWTVGAYNTYNYGGGMAYFAGVADPYLDLWFREGVVVNTAIAPPHISDISKPAGFSASVTVDNAVAGTLYSLQIPTDLKTWTTKTAQTATSSSLSFTDSTTTGTPATNRFYRVIVGP